MPEGIGYNSDGSAKTNATGKSGALGLLSEKLAQGVAKKKKKLSDDNQTQSLSHQAISPMKKQGPQFPSTA